MRQSARNASACMIFSTQSFSGQTGAESGREELHAAALLCRSTLALEPILDEYLPMGRGSMLLPITYRDACTMLTRRAAISCRGRPGTHLDIDHGTYPFVTSSNTVAAMPAAGPASDPRASAVWWASSKPIPPRGGGPFPPSCWTPSANRSGNRGGEYVPPPGARDAAAGGPDVVKASIRLNGLSGLVVTSSMC